MFVNESSVAERVPTARMLGVLYVVISTPVTELAAVEVPICTAPSLLSVDAVEGALTVPSAVVMVQVAEVATVFPVIVNVSFASDVPESSAVAVATTLAPQLSTVVAWSAALVVSNT